MAEVDPGIDDLERFELVGKGGFATVYAAWDRRFRRWVAVKVLDALDDDGRRRFEREIALMGQFDDEVHIVTPYREGYTSAGSPYLVMEYLRGGSLQRVVDDDGPVAVDAAIGYVLPIARALGRAHANGVLHRDVKPANILLTSNDVPKLTDFGIATIREATTTQLAFTLAHSPPETFGSGVDQRDERSDLYSLASTLYTLVAGRSPFERAPETDSQLAYLRRIEADPVPSTAHPRLDEVLATAMAKAPEDRFSTVTQFADALQRVVDPPAARAGVPVPGPRHDRSDRVAGPAPAGRFDDVAGDDPTLVDPSPPRPAVDDEPTTPGPRRHWLWAALAAIVAVTAGTGLSLQFLGDDPADDARSTPTSPTASSAATSSTAARPPLDVPITYRGHTDGVFGVIELDDGNLASFGADDTVRIWDPTEPQGTVATYRGHDDDVLSVIQLSDGNLTSASADGTVQIWDPAEPTGAIATYRGHSDWVLWVAQLDDGTVASASFDTTVQIWDPAEPDTTIVTYRGHADQATSVIQLSDGNLASASGDGTVAIWDPAEPDTTIATYRGHGDWVGSLFLLDDGTVASASAEPTVQVWDPAEPGTTIATYRGHTDWVLWVIALDDGTLASTSDDRTVQIWDPAEPDTTIATYRGHEAFVASVTLLDDGNLASASGDGTVQIWDPSDL